MSEKYDVVVIGGGVIGASIFHSLAKNQLSVAIVEKNRIASGVTAYSGGITRVFHMDSYLSDAAIFSMSYYKKFKEEVGAHITFNECGFVFFPKSEDTELAEKEYERIKNKINVNWLTGAEVNQLKDLQIHKKFHRDYMVYEPESGYVDPVEATKAWVAAGESHGGKKYEGVDVDKILYSEGRAIGVQTNIGPIFSDYVVVASGFSTPRILEHSDISHQLFNRKIQVDLVAIENSQSSPAFIDDQFDLNGRPEKNDTMLIGYPTYDTRFESGRLSVDQSHSLLIRKMATQRFSWADTFKVRGGYTSFECYSNDGRGYTGESESIENVIVASGYSGGGFKIAPYVGKKVFNIIKSGK